MISVKIQSPKRRLLYINGEYQENAGLTPVKVEVEKGINLFETVNGAREIDYRAEVNCSSNTAINLNRIDPEPL